MTCYIIQQTWTSAVSDRGCAFSNRQNILLRGFEEAFHLPLQDLVLVKGPHGKPLVENHPDVFFNLTNTWKHPCNNMSAKEDTEPCNQSAQIRQYYIAGAFAPFPVGIDCEYPRPVSQSLSDRILSVDEKAQLQVSNYPKELFLRFWTLKESYVKFTGEGLSRELSALSFYQDPSGIWLLKDHPEVSFHQFDLFDGLILSLCCKEDCQVRFITL